MLNMQSRSAAGFDLSRIEMGPATAPTKPDTEPVAPPSPAPPNTPVRQPGPDPNITPTTEPGPCHEPIPGICPIR